MTAPEMRALGRSGFVDAIDVSAIQRVESYEKVATAGFSLATVKASEGVGYCDPRTLEHLAGFRAVGMLVNVYGFARPSQGRPREQAQRLYACAGDVFPLRPVLDLEGAPLDWTAARLVAFAEEFIDECSSWGPLSPIFYTYPSFAHRMQPALASSSRIADCPLWIAHYMSTTRPWVPPEGFAPIVPKPWSTWTMHQYSGNGGYRVPGIVGDCDRSLFNGNADALRRFFGLPEKTEGATDEGTAIVHRFDYGRPDAPATETASSDTPDV